MSQETSSSSGKRWHAASWQPLWFLNAHDFAVRDISKGALYGLVGLCRGLPGHPAPRLVELGIRHVEKEDPS